MADAEQLAQPNLRPYGLAGAAVLEAPPWPPEYRQRALATAAAKLAGAAVEPPVGRPFRGNALRSLMIVPIGVVNASVAFAFWAIGDGPAPFLLFIGWVQAFSACTMFVKHWRASPSTPAGAARAAYRALMLKSYDYLHSLRVSTDRTPALRLIPGQEPPVSLPLAGPAELKAYWDEFLTRHRAPYGASMRVLGSTPVADGLELVSIRVHFYQINFARILLFLAASLALVGAFAALYFLHRPLLAKIAFPLSLLSALALLLATYLLLRGHTVTLNKLVVRCGTEWRLFSGEWQGPEEQDLSWLTDTAKTPAQA